MVTADASTAAKRTWLEKVASNPKPAAFVLLLLALGLGVLSIWLGVTYKEPQWPLWIYAGLLGISLAVGGIWLLLFDPQQQGGIDSVRLMVLALGGTIGLITVLLAGVLGYRWWDEILALTTAGGPDPKYTPDERKLAIIRAVLPLPILIVGMGIAFASLLLARTDERSSPFLRRLLYGYNAGVQGLLAVLIIIVANVFVSMKFSKPLDFTSASFYTLSPTSETLLRGLDKPVKVVVVLGPNTLHMSLVKPMLTNCQAVTDKLEVEYFSDDPNKDRGRFQELREKYPDVTAGLLVIYGATETDKGVYKVLKPNDLLIENFDRGQTNYEFRGEDALMTEIDFLTTDRKKTIAYFTQGNSELDIKDNQTVAGGGILAGRLEKKNYEVRPLTISRTQTEVPKDADLVVIAGPKKPLPADFIKALDEYMARKGKLLLMIDPMRGPDGGFLRTGLEDFVSRYGVDLPGEIVFAFDPPPEADAATIFAEPNAKLDKNPLATRFQGKQFILRPVRPVRPQAGPPGMSPFAAEAVLVAEKEQGPWTESDLTVNPNTMNARMKRDRQLFIRKLAPGQENPIPLVVAVSEVPMANPHMGMMRPPPSGEQTPRLVVLGNSTLASNGRIVDPRTLDADYLASCLDWLRGKQNSIGIGTKKSSFYTLSMLTPSLQQSGPYWSFVLLPSLVICLGIIGTGTCVWLVRRR